MTLRLIWWPAVALLAPQRAAAHGGLPGGGGFYSGLVHPILAVEQLLVLLAFGLLLGQAAGAQARLSIGVLAAFLIAGLCSGMDPAQAQTTALGLALGLGVMLAAAVQPPVWALCIAAGLAGWIIGTDTDVPVPASMDRVAAFAPYAGVVVGVSLITLNAAALASVARRPSARIGIRIVGSWITAIALMVLALRLGAAKGL